MACSGSRTPPLVCRLIGLIIALLHASSSAAEKRDGPEMDVLLLGEHMDPPGPTNYLFSGGFSDGTYGYLVPYKLNFEYSGEVVRFPLDNFNSTESLHLTTHNADLKGFTGGFTDGEFGFLVPADEWAKGKVVRFSVQTFSDVTVLNLAETDTSLSVGFAGGFLDGDHGYLMPLGGFTNSKIVRFNSKDFGGVEVLDIPIAHSDIIEISGGFSDGEYGYLVPVKTTKILRFSLAEFVPDFVEVLQLNVGPVDFQGGFSDGHYGYLLPSYTMHRVVRFSLDGDFSNADIQVLNLTGIWACRGGFTDGHAGYIVSKDPIGRAARFDLKDFGKAEAQASDLSEMGHNVTHGYNGGFADRGYVFFVPYNSSTVARIEVGHGPPPRCQKLSQKQLDVVKSYGLTLTGPCAAGQK